MKVKKPELISLEIPSNWSVFKTRFYDISPDDIEKSESISQEDKWLILDTELLVLQYEEQNLYLDMGWYPQVVNENEFSISDGQYIARLINGEGWLLLEEIYQGRSTEDVVEAINNKLLAISIANNDYTSYPVGHKLQRLIPTSGWRFVKNEFFDISPIDILPKSQWHLFHEKLLVLETQFSDKIRIEMGWFPAFEPSGSYHSKLINRNLENPLLEEFSTKNKDEMVEYVNQAMESKINKLSRKREQSERERRRQLNLQIQRNQKI